LRTEVWVFSTTSRKKKKRKREETQENNAQYQPLANRGGQHAFVLDEIKKPQSIQAKLRGGGAE